jgi:hypothetical protein
MALKSKLTLLVAAAALAVPAATADAARPLKGTFLNRSHLNGVRVETTPFNVRTVSFYCVHTRWDVLQFIHVRRDGSFSYHGKARQYGPSAQPWGIHKVRFSGRFTSRKRVRVERKLPGRCGTATVRAKRKRR